MKTCLILARVSTPKQRDDGTIKAQLIELPKLARRKGLSSIATLKDDGISGRSSQRDALQEALELAQAGKYQVLVVRDYKRLMRSYGTDAASVYLQLRELGIWILTSHPEKFFNPYDRNDLLLQTMLAALAQYDGGGLTSVMRSGLMRLAADPTRRTNRRDPYGLRFTRDPEARRGAIGRYEIVESEAVVVREIFVLAEHMGAAMIAWELDRRGHRTRPVLRNAKHKDAPKVRGTWDATSVRRILHSRVYFGEMISTFETESGEIESITKLVPPIVERDVWNRAQTALKTRTTERRPTAQRHQLLCSGLVRCGICGYACGHVHAGSHRRYAYYRCSTTGAARKMKRTPCGQKHHRADAVDAAVWALVERSLGDPQRLAKALGLVSAPTSTWEAKLQEAERGLADLAQAQDEAMELRLEMALDKEGLARQLAKIEAKRQPLIQAVQRARLQLEAASNRQKTMQSLDELAATFRRRAAKATFEERRELLRGLVRLDAGNRITLHADGSVEITGSLDLGGERVPLPLSA